MRLTAPLLIFALLLLLIPMPGCVTTGPQQDVNLQTFIKTLQPGDEDLYNQLDKQTSQAVNLGAVRDTLSPNTILPSAIDSAIQAARRSPNELAIVRLLIQANRQHYVAGASTQPAP